MINISIYNYNNKHVFLIQEVKGKVDKSEILRISADKDRFQLVKLKSINPSERSVGLAFLKLFKLKHLIN